MSAAKVEIKWRIVHANFGASSVFDAFNDAMKKLAEMPGEWYANWSQSEVGKGMYWVEPVEVEY